MSLERALQIADTVLLEGYVLYPYRASSTKNQYRWTFGVVAPRAWSEGGGSDPWWMEAHCLFEGSPTSLRAKLRFQRVVDRTIEAVEDGVMRATPQLDVDGTPWVAWEEGETRVVDVEVPTSGEELAFPFEIAALSGFEPLTNAAGRLVGRVVRERRPLAGTIRARVVRVGDLARVVVRVENTTPFAETHARRAIAMRSSFVGTHVVLTIDGAAFVSTVAPPMHAAAIAAECKGVGLFSSLIGDGDRSDVVLSSPIILGDDPCIAPESPGDFHDAAEIDELLVLRTMTLTEDERRLARATDERAAAIVDRVAGMSEEAIARLHGAVRERPSVLREGGRVRLRPSPRRTDAQDFLYAGRCATIEKVMRDVDGRDCLAVTIEDDPAADLHRWKGRFHYYYVDEVEPIAEGAP